MQDRRARRSRRVDARGEPAQLADVGFHVELDDQVESEPPNAALLGRRGVVDDRHLRGADAERSCHVTPECGSKHVISCVQGTVKPEPNTHGVGTERRWRWRRRRRW